MKWSGPLDQWNPEGSWINLKRHVRPKPLHQLMLLTKLPCRTVNIRSTDELLQSTRQPSSTTEPRSRPAEESAGEQSVHPSHFQLLIGEGSPRPPTTDPLIWWDRINNLFAGNEAVIQQSLPIKNLSARKMRDNVTVSPETKSQKRNLTTKNW